MFGAPKNSPFAPAKLSQMGIPTLSWASSCTRSLFASASMPRAAASRSVPLAELKSAEAYQGPRLGSTIASRTAFTTLAITAWALPSVGSPLRTWPGTSLERSERFWTMPPLAAASSFM